MANPAAGRGGALRLAARAAAALGADGHVVHDLTGGTAADAAGRLERAVAGGLDAVVGVGGDGVVHLLAQQVAGTRVALGVLPAGTGNDVARALGLPVGDAAAALRCLLAGLRRDPRPVDALRVHDATGRSSWCVAAVAAGFDAAVNRRANAMARPWGRARYLVAVVRELPHLVPRRYTLTLDGAVESVDAVLVTVANTPSYGGGLRIAPDASVVDGRLDVVVVGAIPRAELVRMLPTLRTGSHVHHLAVSTRTALDVRVAETGPGAPVEAFGDGEHVGPLPLRCVVVPGALRVLASAPPPAATQPTATR